MTLVGERTRLRAVEPEDVDRIFEWVNDPEVTEHLLLRIPLSRAFEREWVERASKRVDYRNVVLAIERIEDGALIGTCGLHGQTPEDRSSELGVNIGEKAQWGQGYGFDALRTLITFGFRDMNLRRIELHVDENHPRGIALYEKLGFRHEGRARGQHWSRGRPLDLLLMGITREEFDERYGAWLPVGEEAGRDRGG